MRDDFSQKTKDVLAKRVGHRCSKPDCRQPTCGPHTDPQKASSIGIAAHITAAAPGGPRYDASLSSEQRKSIENGLWLCQNCGKLIDSDVQKYSVEVLVGWKHESEQQAQLAVEQSIATSSSTATTCFKSYLESVISHYQQWWKHYAFMDEIDEETWFEFTLSSTTKDKSQNSENPPINQAPQLVLDAIRDYASEKILIVGTPGAGKSTLLAKVLAAAATRAQEHSDAPIPVLIELRDLKLTGDRPGLRGLILRSLEGHDPSLDEEALKKLLQERRLLLLVDGLNEISEAKRDLKNFCRNIPLIATGRNDSDGWEIERKLELQPLSTSEVSKFFQKRLPNADRSQLKTLGDRVRDFGETPLMVWMLYSIFRVKGSTPTTRGGAYRTFTTLYAERAKEGVDLTDSQMLLGKLAFEMMQSRNPDDQTGFELKISENDTQRILGGEATLKRMLNHLLKQQGSPGNREISFCHQSLQEYYAAEYLRLELENHPEWIEDRDKEGHSWFQIHYLNYLKWTESLAIMLSLTKDKERAVKVVDLALDVDLMLGTRLAGEVANSFQQSTLEKVTQIFDHQEVPKWLQIDLLGNTKSPIAALILDEIIFKIEDVELRKSAVFSLQNLPQNIAIPRLSKILQEDPDENVRRQAILTLGFFETEEAISLIISSVKDSSSIVRERAYLVLSEINSENAICGMIEFLVDACNRDEELHSGRIEDAYLEPQEESNIVTGIEYSLTQISPSEVVTPILIEVLLNNSEDPYARKYSAKILGKLGHQDSEEIITAFQNVKDDSNFDVHYEATRFLNRVNESEHQRKEKLQQKQVQQVSIRETEVKQCKERIASPNPIIRGNAVLDLSRYLGQYSIDYVEKSLNDESPYVRAHGVQCFAKLDSYKGFDCAERALYDPELQVKVAAMQALSLISKERDINIAVKAGLIEELKIQIRSCSENHERATYMSLLVDLIKFQPSLSMREDLKNLLLETAKEQDYLLQSYALNGLKNISGSDVAKCLIEIIQTGHFLNASKATEILGNLEPKISKNFILDLRDLTFSNVRNPANNAIRLIQEKCRFYNYEIYKESQVSHVSSPEEHDHQSTDSLVQIERDVATIKKQMTEIPRTFHIQGNYIEKVEGDYIEHNYAPEANLASAEQQLNQLLVKLRAKHSDKTDAEIFEILLSGFNTMPQRNPTGWQRWKDVLSLLFAGGFEAFKVAKPEVGIPLEVLKRLYEIYDRNRKQLPEA